MNEQPSVNPWDAASDSYDRNVVPLVSLWIPDMISRAAPQPSHDVLDIAAGSGALALAIAPRVRRVVAVDLAPAMLALLEAHARAASIGNVRTEVMDGQVLSFDDDSFDTACSSFGVMFYADRVRGLREMRRVIRPDGRAVVAVLGPPAQFELFGMFLDAVRTTVPGLPALSVPPPIFSLADPRRLDDELRSAGFGTVEVDSIVHDITLDDVDELWTIVSSAAPPMVALLQQLGPDVSARIRETLAGRLEERFGSGPMRLSNQAHLAVATD